MKEKTAFKKRNILILLYLALIVAGFVVYKIGFGADGEGDIKTVLLQYSMPAFAVLSLAIIALLKKMLPCFVFVWLAAIAGSICYPAYAFAVFPLIVCIWFLKFSSQTNRLCLLLVYYSFAVAYTTALYMLIRKIQVISLLLFSREMLPVIAIAAVVTLLFAGFGIMNKPSLQKPLSDVKESLLTLSFGMTIVLGINAVYVFSSAIYEAFRWQVIVVWACLLPYILYRAAGIYSKKKHL